MHLHEIEFFCWRERWLSMKLNMITVGKAKKNLRKKMVISNLRKANVERAQAFIIFYALQQYKVGKYSLSSILYSVCLPEIWLKFSLFQWKFILWRRTRRWEGVEKKCDFELFVNAVTSKQNYRQTNFLAIRSLTLLVNRSWSTSQPASWSQSGDDASGVLLKFFMIHRRSVAIKNLQVDKNKLQEKVFFHFCYQLI